MAQRRNLSGLLGAGLLGGLVFVITLGGCPGQSLVPGGVETPVVAGGTEAAVVDGVDDDAPATADNDSDPVGYGALAGQVAELLDQGVIALSGQAVGITLGANVAGVATVQFQIVSQPQHGELGNVVPTGATTAAVSYTPDEDFAGSDRFSYRVAAGGVVSAPAVVEIEVLEAVYFALDVYDGPPPLTVRGEAYTLSGEPLPAGEYLWDFGGTQIAADGTEDAMAQHTFTHVGVHTVALVLTLAGASGPVGCVHDGAGSAAPNVAGATQVVVSPSVSGYVLSGGQALTGIEVRASGVAEAATSNTQGFYQLSVPYDWSGEITPDDSQHQFTPSSVALSHVTEDQTGVNFNEDKPSNQAPVAIAGPDLTLFDHDLNGTEPLLLDASASYDPDGEITWYRWSYESSLRGAGVLAEGSEPKVQVALELGDYEITLGVTDDEDALATDKYRVDVYRPGILAIDPTDGLVSAGRQGSGVFTPASEEYTLTNTGEWRLEWSASKSQDWLQLSAVGGELDPVGQATVVVSIDGDAADTLPPGVYSDTVVIRNETADKEYTREVQLTVLPPLGVLEVTPAGGLSSNGPEGGPFDPAERTYTLENVGGESLNWSAAATENWLDVTPASGALAAGATVEVVVEYNANANALSPGLYEDTVSFVNTSNHQGDTTRPVELTVNAPEGCLGVTPADELVSSGPIGGPFDPASKTYTLKNVGGQPIAWTASKTANWLDVSPASGNLSPNQSVQVTVTLNANANALAVNPNPYTDTVSFVNTTNHCGDTSRDVSLTVTETPAMVVTPQDDFESVGPEGGDFDPPSKVYTLENTGGQPFDWEVSATVNWLDIAPASGTVGVGEQVEVTVSLNANANALPFQPEFYTDTVSLVNTTNGDGNTTRDVSLRVLQLADSISQYGITWYFDKEYPVGQFVNGDWWVCPNPNTTQVTVLRVDPAATGSGSSARNGSMRNPSDPTKQAFDGRADNAPYLAYDGKLLVFYPVLLAAGDALISAQSLTSLQGQSYIDSAAVLTVLASPPPSRSFRPPYFGPARPIYSAASLRTDLLPHVPRVAGEESWTTIRATDYCSTPNLDWGLRYVREYIVPIAQYGAGYAGTWTVRLNKVILKCCMDHPVEDKLPSIYRAVQNGIDIYYFCENGTYYSGDGGHGFGRKLPILFAGLMLDDADMLSIGSRVPTADGWQFGEDAQSFYVTRAGVPDGALDGLGTLERTYPFAKTETVQTFALTGVAQAGGHSTVTLAPAASSTNNYYKNLRITIVSGPGAGQTRAISSYNGTTKVATISSAWVTQPTGASEYAITNDPANSIVLQSKTGISEPANVQGLFVEFDTTPVQRRYCDYFNMNSLLATFSEPFASPLTAGVTKYTIINYEEADVATSEWGMYHFTTPIRDTKSYYAGYRGVADEWSGIMMGALFLGLESSWNHPAFFDYEDRIIPIMSDRGDYPHNNPWYTNLWNTYRGDY